MYEYLEELDQMNWSARGNVLNQYLRNTSIGTTVKYNSSNIGADRSGFSGRRRAAQGRRIIKNSGRRIIKNSGRRIIINIRHNYMHDVTRSKSGGVRRNEGV